MRQDLRIDARAAITDAHAEVTPRTAATALRWRALDLGDVDGDAAAGRRDVERVDDEVGHRLLQQQQIAVQESVFDARVHHELDVALDREAPEQRARVL